MSEVRIKLSHTKTVMIETWSYVTRAKTRQECVETEPRQRRVNMCLETSRDETRVSRLHHWKREFEKYRKRELCWIGNLPAVIENKTSCSNIELQLRS